MEKKGCRAKLGMSFDQIASYLHWYLFTIGCFALAWLLIGRYLQGVLLSF